MSIPVVIIVGRPNVGKSSLFNCLARRRISIVDPVCGVTRDRVSVRIDFRGKYFELLDTGGIGINDVDHLDDEINAQIEIAIKKADLILFVVDVHDGITPLDITIAERFRRVEKPIQLVVNKVDSNKLELYVNEFFKMGMGTPLQISAVERNGRTKLLEKITSSIITCKKEDDDLFETSDMKLAIVGRRNAGKSSLINTLANEERVIVSEVAGTTRDSIDVRFTLKNESFLAIDTAGIRKKSSIQDSVEFYSIARTQKAIRRADVILLMIDVTLKISQIEKKLGDYIKEQVKPCIIVCNKWDLVENAGTKDFAKYINASMPGLSFAPISFISAINRENVVKTIRLAQDLFKQSEIRISTPQLNNFLEKALRINKPAARRAKVAKIYYGTQVDVKPPTFALFVNDKKMFDQDYERFLSNQLRKEFDFPEIPFRILFKPKVVLKERKEMFKKKGTRRTGSPN